MKNNPLVLDLEVKVTNHIDDNGKEYSDYGIPYNKTNRVVLCGSISPDTKYSATTDMASIDLTKYTSLIGHNIKYDALWLRTHGHDVSAIKLEDTMLREVIASCGVYGPAQGRMCNLDKTGERRGGVGKIDLFKIYLQNGVNTHEQPPSILSRYLKGDVWNTAKAYVEQSKDRNLKKQRKYLKFASDLIHPILDMEFNGAKYNTDVEIEVKEWLQSHIQNSERDLWKALKAALTEKKLNQIIDIHDHQQAGSAKYTKLIDSSAAMSRIVYSMQVKKDSREDFKKDIKWFKPWERGAQKKIDDIISQHCEKLPYGLNVKPKASWMQAAQVAGGIYIGATGFKASSKLMTAYIEVGDPPKKIKPILEAYMQYSRARVWIATNLASFKKGLCDDGFIHGNFNQCGTVTLRFSSSAPNLQNLPRGGTMPLKRLICSRFNGGHIINADYGQLEFRAVGWLANDDVLIADVEAGFDIHLHTAKIAFGEDRFGEVGFDEDGDVLLTEEQSEMRQKAKTSTFAFQYGAIPKNKIQQKIFDAFYGKYKKVAMWQEAVIAEIIQFKKYTCPFTGKIFAFPKATFKNQRTWATKAKNYPVQFLSAVITQCAMIDLHSQIKDRDDIKLILQVHDSLVVDADKGVLDEAARLVHDSMAKVERTFKMYFNKTIDVRMDVDIEVGPTYFDHNKYKIKEAA